MKLVLRIFLALAIASLGLPSLGAADIFVYTTTLDGPSEIPPNASPGTGSAMVTIDTVTHIMTIGAIFSDLLGTTTAAHIHAATAVPFTGVAGVATQTPSFVGFPLGVTSGTYDHSFDTNLPSTYNPAFFTANGGTPAGAEAALVAALAEGRAYFNIHSSVFPAGEIRGFLSPAPVPGTLLLFGSGLIALAGGRFRQQRR